MASADDCDRPGFGTSSSDEEKTTCTAASMMTQVVRERAPPGSRSASEWFWTFRPTQTYCREVRVPEWLAPQVPVVEAVVALLAPHVEAVAHDVQRDVVVAMWNPRSDRRVGDPSLLEPQLLQAAGEGAVSGPYAKVDVRGVRWTSVSVPLGGGQGLLCLNFDRSVLDAMVVALTSFAAAVEPRPAGLFERDWREEVNALVDDWCRTASVPRSRLGAGQRRELVRMLDGKGVFDVRHAAAHVAAALEVSRATVYSLLKTVRSAPVVPPERAAPTSDVTGER